MLEMVEYELKIFKTKTYIQSDEMHKSHNDLIKGRYDSFTIERWSYKIFSSLYDFAMLRHAHYALTWAFDAGEEFECLDDIALFSLLINNHNDKAREIIEKYKSDYNFDNRCFLFEGVLSIIRPEWLSAASKDMCELLLTSFPNDKCLKYIVTSWCIMSDYEMSNLDYVYDHKFVYENLGKEIPNHIYAKILDGDKHIMDYEILGNNFKESFYRMWDELDLEFICRYCMYSGW